MRQRKLTTKQCEHATPGRHTDGEGLSLLKKESGRSSWTLRIAIDGKRRDIGLGPFPKVGLAEARQKADQIRAEVLGGADPVADRHAPQVPTFAEAAEAVHALLLPTWRNDQHGREWLDSLHRHATPLLVKPCDRITRADVLDVLEPIWLDKPETARRVRQRIRKVLAWTMARHESILSNAAGEAIDAALVPQPKVKAHQRAIHYSEVPTALAAIEAGQATSASKLCLRLLILTGTRSGEARLADWSEIDFERTLWIIPPERTKTGIEHRVPLSRQALDTLDAAKAIADGSGLIFASPLRPGYPLDWNSLLKVLKTVGIASTAHGFRSSLRSWCQEQPGIAWATAELILGHRPGTKVEQAYARSDELDARRNAMQGWADFAAGAVR
ncbi:tyrosine-type recombinase/integrase [Candidatus Poriferisodalis sp.]|uniref:tyrosine-type recombinase/integrase n=1 Tax=Candidatus Poriferisodalis sp. TaxID=3101277 RepID=UPI003B0274C3